MRKPNDGLDGVRGIVAGLLLMCFVMFIILITR